MPTVFNLSEVKSSGFLKKEMFTVAEQFQFSNVFFSEHLPYLPGT
jgi:hypothetical protein